jgi:uroporphyrin-III C-methyltransferase
MRMGLVSIVGAGPGDPELITVKALDRLRRADVVLYDRLIGFDLLKEARADATLINVGKERGTEDLQQSLIHELMVDFARKGQTVCRLKGGDPFVFGRGGEEADVLREAGIPFEVIPGISSAIAGPAAAGIPVTHREHNHGFMVISGNRSHRFGSPEWSAARLLAQAGGTVVVLMGLGRLDAITGFLLSSGCDADLPAAVVANATRTDQEACVGSLGNIVERSNEWTSPAILILGSVVLANGWLMNIKDQPGCAAQNAAQPPLLAKGINTLGR